MSGEKKKELERLGELVRLTLNSPESEVMELVEAVSSGIDAEELESRKDLALRLRKQLKKPVKSRKFMLNIAMVVLAIVFGVMAVFGDEENVRRVEELDQNFLTKVLRGKKSDEVDWVVFFYKPYCGACRRVRPFYHALAQTTNTTKLRFGEIDCVKWRPLCSHAGAKSQPMIKVYSSRSQQQQQKKIKKRYQNDARHEVATWQGLLVAYELFDWFKEAEEKKLLPDDIQWPTDSMLARSMLDFKQKNDVRHDRATSKKTSYSPRLYLDAVHLAWKMSLHDAIFQKETQLTGERLFYFRAWLETLATSLPLKSDRDTVQSLQASLAGLDHIKEARLARALLAHDINEPRSWDTVKPLCPSDDREYPCSLWLLFHTLLANSDSQTAPIVLNHIHTFVTHFFGCSECAQHFHKMFLERDGGSVTGAIEANIWLWKAHNVVSQRLFSSPRNDFIPWPDNSTCRSCFKSYSQTDDQASLSSSTADQDDEYDEGYVFQFLAETYCFDSDTFVCAAFDDPSRNKKHRRTHRSSSTS